MNKLAKWFDSEETDKPFSSCLVCRLPLALASDTWIVNKHYHRGECTHEYAICENCRDQISSSFSDESKAAIRSFLENEIDWEKMILEWMALADPVQRLSRCVACEISRESMEGFTISAQFDKNGKLIENALPLILCSDCTARITSSLSPESLAAWQHFISEYFDGPETDSTNLGFF